MSFLFIVSSKNDLSKHAVIFHRGVLWPIMFVPKDHMLKLYFLGVTRFGDGRKDAVTMMHFPSKRQRPGNQASESETFLIPSLRQIVQYLSHQQLITQPAP